MRPHRLRLTAFGAFAQTQQVCFDDLEGLFLLHGETGAGKTTLLDAIAFALYGRVPGERGKAKRLRSDHAAADVATEVELEATVGGRRLRITRKPEQERPKRSGSGTTKEPASVRLEEATASGGWELKSTRVGEADDEITTLMGMSAEQFFQVVLLPQGQFAQFLHASADKRAELLQKLFGTDRFRAVEDWLAERRRATTAEVDAAAELVDRLLARVAQAAGVPTPDPDPAHGTSVGPWQAVWAAALAASAAADRDAAATLAAERKQDLDEALRQQRAAEQLADRQRRRGAALRRQAELSTAAPEIARLRVEADAASRAAEVAPVLDEADRASAAAAAARANQEQALAAIPVGIVADLVSLAEAGQTETGNASGAVLRSASEEQQAQLGRFDALRAAELQAEREDETACAARDRADELESALAAVEAEAAVRGERRRELVLARDDASQAAARLPTALARADSARRLAADSALLVSERAARDLARQAHLVARENSNALWTEALRVREARIDGMRAELAAALVDGAPCPVCGSLDHPELCELPAEPVSREREDAANAAADQASAAADKAGQNLAAVDAVIADLTQRLTSAGFAVPEEDAALAAAAREAAERAGRFDAEAAVLRAAAAGLDDLQHELDELDAALSADAARQVELAGLRTATLAEAEAAARRADDRREELRAQLGGAPDLATAITATRRLAETLAGAADAADETVRTAAEALDAGQRALRAATDAGFGAASSTGTATPSESEGDGSGDGALDAARQAWHDTRWRRDAAERISRHESEKEAVATLLADRDLDVPLDPGAPPAPVEAAADATAAAREAHDAAVDAHGRARHTAEQLAGLRPQLGDALATLEPRRARAEEARQLADLAAGLGANQYRMTLSSFVLAARLEEVAAAASQRLLTMTAGRYSLVHTDARRGGGRAGLGLLACDSWTGIDRDTSTLSGGETFIASLALALGLADVVTAEAAGTPMEALFVDEGFGTLDEDTLDEVMNVLDSLREGGRIVGIVSHVTELRQRVPAQVHVHKGRRGSHVSVTIG
jgi:exonuclease SbcC